MTCGPQRRIPVGISSCLLGQSVRYDGSHKRNAYLTDVLGSYFEYLPLCPEVAIGMGIPRPPIRLTGDPAQPRAVAVNADNFDVTEKLIAYAHSVMATGARISGYIFKSRSPSCAMQRVKVYSGKAKPSGTSAGLYAGVVMHALPLMPVEEEDRLDDPVLRESFVARVFVYDRWQQLHDEEISPCKLIAFHTRHKILLLSHSELHYRRLGRLVADAGTREMQSLSLEYIATLMEGLKRRATRRRHANVLQRIFGYLKRSIGPDDRTELSKLIEDYKQGTVPLIAPIKLIEHHFRHHPDDYVGLQLYLNPHPAELGLRNHL